MADTYITCTGVTLTDTVETVVYTCPAATQAVVTIYYANSAAITSLDASVNASGGSTIASGNRVANAVAVAASATGQLGPFRLIAGARIVMRISGAGDSMDAQPHGIETT